MFHPSMVNGVTFGGVIPAHTSVTEPNANWLGYAVYSDYICLNFHRDNVKCPNPHPPKRPFYVIVMSTEGSPKLISENIKLFLPYSFFKFL